MTRSQANAMLTALIGQKMPASAVLTFDDAGAEQWAVQLDSSHVYNGAQLAQLAAYCEANQLSLSMQVVTIGVV